MTETAIHCPPTYEWVPDYLQTSVDEVVDLCRLFEVDLDGHQQHVLGGALGEREDGKWSATRVGMVEPRQNGKSYILLARTLAGLLVFGENRIIHSAHEVKTALEAFRKLENMCKDYNELSRWVKKISHINGREGIEFKDPRTGRTSLVSYLARSVGSGRGYSADAILLDESQELSYEVFSAILPTVSAQPNTQIWLCGTPPGPKMNGEVLTQHRERAHARSGARLAWYEWGVMVDHPESFDYTDRQHWVRVNPAYPERISMEAMEDEFESMDEDTFRRERLGEWEKSGAASIIPMPVWQRQADPEGASVSGKTLALDLSPSRGVASVLLAGFMAERPDGIQRRFVEVLASGPGTDWIGTYLRGVLDANPDIRAVIVDDASPAAALAIPLKRMHSIQVTLTNAKDMARACGQAYDGIMNGTVFHADQDELTAAMKGSKKRDLVDAWGLTRRRSEVDIQAFVGAVLALYGTVMPKVKRPVAGTRGRRKVLVR